jgi:hypothetical protein
LEERRLSQFGDNLLLPISDKENEMNRKHVRTIVLAFILAVILLGVSAVAYHWDYVKSLIARLTSEQQVEIVSYPGNLDIQWWPISDNKSSLAENGFTISYVGDIEQVSFGSQTIVLTKAGEIYDKVSHQCVQYVETQNHLRLLNACNMATSSWALAYVKGKAVLLQFKYGEWFYSFINQNGFYH